MRAIYASTYNINNRSLYLSSFFGYKAAHTAINTTIPDYTSDFSRVETPNNLYVANFEFPTFTYNLVYNSDFVSLFEVTNLAFTSLFVIDTFNVAFVSNFN